MSWNMSHHGLVQADEPSHGSNVVFLSHNQCKGEVVDIQDELDEDDRLSSNLLYRNSIANSLQQSLFQSSPQQLDMIKQQDQSRDFSFKIDRIKEIQQTENIIYLSGSPQSSEVNPTQSDSIFSPQSIPTVPSKYVKKQGGHQSSKFFSEFEAITSPPPLPCSPTNPQKIESSSEIIRKYLCSSQKLGQNGHLNLVPSQSALLTMSMKLAPNPEKSKQMWRTNFFKLLLLTNKFVFRMKKYLIFRRPHMLEKRHADVIADKATYRNTGHITIAEETIPKRRSRLGKKLNWYFILFKRRIRILYLPILKCFAQMGEFSHQLNRKIPVFDPFHIISILWDILMIVNIVMNLLKIPLEIAFEFNPPGFIDDINFFTIAFNLIVSINTAFYSQGELIVERSQIFWNYVHNQSASELLTTVCMFWKDPIGSQVFRMLYLLRIIEFNRRVDKIRQHFHVENKYAQLIDLSMLLIQILYLCHVIACFWYKIGWYVTHDLQERSWISYYHEEQNPTVGEYYVNSIYFAVVTITTIGYGDITPQHYLERLFVAVMAFASALNFGYALNQIGSIIQALTRQQQEYLQATATINKYMKEMQVPYHLQSQARKYVEYVFEENVISQNSAVSSLAVLSQTLQTAIIREIHMRYIRSIPTLINNFSIPFLEKISMCFEERSYGSGEIIVDQNETRVPAIYVVTRGSVQISMKLSHSDEFRKVKRLSTQMHFGITEFFSNANHFHHSVHSHGISTVLILKVNDFVKILDDYKEDKEKYCFLKDSLNLYSDYEKIGVNCVSCRSQSHLVSECSLLGYHPSKLIVVKQLLEDSENQFNAIRRNETRARKFNSLHQRAKIENDANEIAQEYFDDLSEIQISQVLLQDEVSPLKPIEEIKNSPRGESNNELSNQQDIDQIPSLTTPRDKDSEIKKTPTLTLKSSVSFGSLSSKFQKLPKFAGGGGGNTTPKRKEDVILQNLMMLTDNSKYKRNNFEDEIKDAVHSIISASYNKQSSSSAINCGIGGISALAGVDLASAMGSHIDQSQLAIQDDPNFVMERMEVFRNYFPWNNFDVIAKRIIDNQRNRKAQSQKKSSRNKKRKHTTKRKVSDYAKKP